MTALDFAQIALFLFLLLALTPLLGGYMAHVFTGKRTLLSPALRPVEMLIYRLTGVNAADEMTWKTYAAALIAFNALGFVALLALQMAQGWLPLNPQGLPNVPLGLAFNTAASFVTNTNWQSYAGETTMSDLTQMVGLAVQNFTSAATGIAVLLALTRGLRPGSATTVGNFWSDVTRTTLYVLLPLSLVLALVFVAEGVPQTWKPYAQATPLDGGTQTIPLGPAASQIAIKQLGTNGGGFFNANSAHPLENPTPLTNCLQTLAILLIPAALTHTYGVMVGVRRQGWAILAAMMGLFLVGLGVALWAEYAVNPAIGIAGAMEGKEVRFGVTNSALWTVATTAASHGSVNGMVSSASPLTGFVAMFNMQLGEVVFGGAGAGLYGMLVFVILTVFIAGLMVGRTPEYLGKKIHAAEIKMAMVAVLAPSACILILAAFASISDVGLASVLNQGPHGLSEILYAYSSAAGNNGSAFAGLNANTDFYNVTLGVAILIGRFGVILPVLAIAGSMAGKRVTPPSSGTFPTDNLLFVVLLIAVVIIVGALTFFPALSLGPLMEHLLMQGGRTF